VVWAGIAQHGVSHRNIVLHLTGNGYSFGLRRRPRSDSLLGGWRRLTRSDGVDRDIAIRRQSLITRGRSVGLKNKCNDAGVSLRSQYAGPGWGHRELNERQQITSASRAPVRKKLGPAQRGSVARAREILLMTCSAIRLVICAAGGGL